MEDPSAYYTLGVVVFFIFLSAFFSGSETGLIGVTRAKIHKLKMEGHKRAQIVSKLREDKEGLIGAILLGNNLVNIAGSALATSLAIKMFGEKGVFWATGCMTIVVLIFAEVLPKTYAVRNSEKVALLVAPIFVVITKLLAPITKFVQIIVNVVLNIFSKPGVMDMTGVEVLRGAVDMYHEEGNVHKEDKDMLSGIFDLEETDVEEVMVHRTDIESVDIESPIENIIKFFVANSHSRIPLWRDNPDNIVGILHTKDLFKALQNSNGDAQKLDLNQMLREPWFVPETTTLKNQLRAFREKQQHIALVVDEFGGLTGLITLEDILEEVVGEIEDEHDMPNQRRFRKFRDGSVNLDGDMAIRDVNKHLDWNLSDEYATTVAGLVMHEAQKIPDIGEEIAVEERIFKILKKDGTQITRIKVYPKGSIPIHENEEKGQAEENS